MGTGSHQRRRYDCRGHLRAGDRGFEGGEADAAGTHRQRFQDKSGDGLFVGQAGDSGDDFADMVTRGEMLEWAVVHGRSSYGTPRGPVQAALADGRIAAIFASYGLTFEPPVR